MEQYDQYSLRASFGFTTEPQTFNSMATVQSQLRGIESSVKRTARTVSGADIGGQVGTSVQKLDKSVRASAQSVQQFSKSTSSIKDHLKALKSEFRALRAEYKAIDLGKDLTDDGQFESARYQVKQYVTALKSLESQVHKDTAAEREFAAVLKIQGRQAKAASEMAEEQRKATEMAGRVGQFEAVRDVGKAVFQKAGKEAKTAIKLFADFDSQMSGVEAVMEFATNEQRAKDMAALRKTAMELGASTRYTAKEAAEAMEFLGQAGYATNDVLISVKDTLNLASAGELELGQATSIATNVLAGFQLKVTDMGRVTDVLAKGAAATNSSVQDLGDALSYAAPNAALFGATIEETTALLGLMANAGIAGSRSGTAMRSAFLRLAKPPKMAQAAIQELGISLVDQDGKMRNIIDIFHDLAKATNLSEDDLKSLASASDGSTEALDAVASSSAVSAKAIGQLNAIFGTEGVSGAAAVLQQVDQLDELNTKLDESKAAAGDMAKVMEDNLGGSFRSFSSAMEAVKLNMIEPLIPLIRLVVDTSTKFLLFLANLPMPVRVAIAVTAGLTIGLAALAVVVGTVGALFAGFAQALATVNAAALAMQSGALIPLTGFFESTLTASIATNPMTGLFKTIRTSAVASAGPVSMMAGQLSGLVQAAMALATSPLATVLLTVLAISTVFDQIAPGVSVLGTALSALISPIALISGIIVGFFKGILDFVGTDINTAMKQISLPFQTISKALEQTIATFKHLEGLGETIGRQFATSLLFPFTFTIDYLEESWSNLIKFLQGKLEGFVDFTKTIGGLLVGNLNHGAADVVGEAWNRNTKSISGLLTNLVSFAKGIGQSMVNLLNHGAADVVGNAWKRNTDFILVLLTGLVGKFTAIGHAIVDVFDGVGQSVGNIFKTQVIDRITNARESVTKFAASEVKRAGNVKLQNFETVESGQQVTEFLGRDVAYRNTDTLETPKYAEFLKQHQLEVVKSFQDETTGFSATLLRSLKGEASKLIFAGTDPSSFADIRDDSVRVVGSGQFEKNKTIIAEMIEAGVKEGGKKIDIIGHSLGGALAQSTAVEFTDQIGTVETFNAPGISPRQIKDYKKHVAALQQAGETAPTVRHNVSDGDIVSAGGAGFVPGEVDLFKHKFDSFAEAVSPVNLLTNHLEYFFQEAEKFDKVVISTKQLNSSFYHAGLFMRAWIEPLRLFFSLFDNYARVLIREFDFITAELTAIRLIVSTTSNAFIDLFKAPQKAIEEFGSAIGFTLDSLAAFYSISGQAQRLKPLGEMIYYIADNLYVLVEGFLSLAALNIVRFIEAPIQAIGQLWQKLTSSIIISVSLAQSSIVGLFNKIAPAVAAPFIGVGKIIYGVYKGLVALDGLVVQILTSIARSAINALYTAFKSLMDLVNDVSYTELSVIGSFIKAVVDITVAWAKDIVKAAQWVVRTTVSLLKKAYSFISWIIRSVANSVWSIAKSIGNTIWSITKSIASGIGGFIKKNFGGLLQWMGDSLASFANSIGNFFSGIASGVWNAITSLVGSIDKLLQELAIYRILRMQAGLLFAELGGMYERFVIDSKARTDRLAKWTAHAFESIKTAAKATFDYIANAISFTIHVLSELFTDFPQAIEDIKAGLQSAFRDLKAGIRAVGDFASATLHALADGMNALGQAIGKMVVTAILEPLKQGFQALGRFIKLLGTDPMEAIRQLSSALSRIGKQVFDTAKWVFDGISFLVSDTFSVLFRWIGTVLNSIYQFLIAPEVAIANLAGFIEQLQASSGRSVTSLAKKLSTGINLIHSSLQTLRDIANFSAKILTELFVSPGQALADLHEGLNKTADAVSGVVAKMRGDLAEPSVVPVVPTVEDTAPSIASAFEQIQPPQIASSPTLPGATDEPITATLPIIIDPVQQQEEARRKAKEALEQQLSGTLDSLKAFHFKLPSLGDVIQGIVAGFVLFTKGVSGLRQEFSLLSQAFSSTLSDEEKFAARKELLLSPFVALQHALTGSTNAFGNVREQLGAVLDIITEKMDILGAIAILLGVMAQLLQVLILPGSELSKTIGTGLFRAFSFLAPTIIVIAILTGWFEKLEDVLFNLPTTAKRLTETLFGFFGEKPSPELLGWFDSVQNYASNLRATIEAFSSEVLRPLISLLVNIFLPAVAALQALVFVFGQANPLFRAFVGIFAASEIQGIFSYIGESLGLITEALGPIATIIGYILSSAAFAPVVAVVAQVASSMAKAANQVQDVVGIPDIPMETIDQARKKVLTFSELVQHAFEVLSQVVPRFVTEMAANLNNAIIGLLGRMPFGEMALGYYRQILAAAAMIAGPAAKVFGFIAQSMLGAFRIIVERFPSDQFAQLGKVFLGFGGLAQIAAMAFLRYFGKIAWGSAKLLALLIRPWVLVRRYQEAWSKSLFPLFTPFDILISGFRKSISNDVGGSFDILEVKTKRFFDTIVPGLTRMNRVFGQGTAMAGEVTVASLKMDGVFGKLVRSILWVNAAFQVLFFSAIVFTLLYLAIKSLDDKTIESIRSSHAFGLSWGWLANTLETTRAIIRPLGDSMWGLGKNIVPTVKQAMAGWSYVLEHIGKRDIPYLLKSGAPLINLANSTTEGTKALFLMTDKLGQVSIAPDWAVNVVSLINSIIEGFRTLSHWLDNVVQIIKIFVSIVTVVPIAFLGVLMAVNAVLKALRLWLVMIRTVTNVTFGVIGAVGKWLTSYFLAVVSALRGDTSSLKKLLTRDFVNPVIAAWGWLTTQLVNGWNFVKKSAVSALKAIVVGALWAAKATLDALISSFRAIINLIQFIHNSPKNASNAVKKTVGDIGKSIRQANETSKKNRAETKKNATTSTFSFEQINKAIQSTIGWLALLGVAISLVLLAINPMFGIVGLGLSFMVSDFEHNFRMIDGLIYALGHPIEWLDKAITKVFDVLTGPVETPFLDKLGQGLGFILDIFKNLFPFIALGTALFIAFTFATNKPAEAIGKLIGTLLKGVGVIGLLVKAVVGLVNAFKSLGSPEWQLRFAEATDKVRSAKSPFKYQTEQAQAEAKKQIAIQKATLEFRGNMDTELKWGKYKAQAELVQGAGSESKGVAAKYKKFVTFQEKEFKNWLGETKKYQEPSFTEAGEIEIERRVSQDVLGDKGITDIAKESGLIAALEQVGADISPDKLREILSASDPSKKFKAIVDDSRRILEAQAEMQTQHVQEMTVANLTILGMKGGTLVSPQLAEERNQATRAAEEAKAAQAAKAAAGPTVEQNKFQSPLDFKITREYLEGLGERGLADLLKIEDSVRLGDLDPAQVIKVASALQPDPRDQPDMELSAPILPGSQANPKLNQSDYSKQSKAGQSIAELDKRLVALQVLAYASMEPGGDVTAAGGQIEDIVQPGDIRTSTDLLKAMGNGKDADQKSYGTGKKQVSTYDASKIEGLIQNSALLKDYEGMEMLQNDAVGIPTSSVHQRLAQAYSKDAKDKNGGTFDSFRQARNEIIREILEHQVIQLESQLGDLTQTITHSQKDIVDDSIDKLVGAAGAASADIPKYVPKTKMEKLKAAVKSFQSQIAQTFRKRVLESGPVKAMQDNTQMLQRASEVPQRKEKIENVRKKAGIGSDYEYLYRLGLTPQSPAQNLLSEIGSGSAGTDMKHLMKADGMSLKRAQQIVTKLSPAKIAAGGTGIGDDLDKLIQEKSNGDREYNELKAEVLKLKEIVAKSSKALNKTMLETLKVVNNGSTFKSRKTLVVDLLSEIHNLGGADKEVYAHGGALISRLKMATDATKGKGFDAFIDELKANDKQRKEVSEPFWKGVTRLAKVHLGREDVSAEEVAKYLEGRLSSDPEKDPSAVAMKHFATGVKGAINPFERYQSLLTKYSRLINDVMAGRIESNKELKDATVKYLKSQNKTTPADYMEFTQQKTPGSQNDALKMLDKLGLVEELRGNRAAKDYFGIDPKEMSVSDEELKRFSAQMEILQGKFYETDSDTLKEAFEGRRLSQAKVFDAIAKIAQLGDLDPAELIRPDITSEQLQAAKKLRVSKLTALASAQNKSLNDLKIASKDFQAFVSGKFYKVDIGELERIATELGMTAQGSETVSEQLKRHLGTLSLLDADKTIGNQIRKIAKKLVTVPLNVLGITALQETSKYRKELEASLHEIDAVERRLALEQQQAQQKRQTEIDNRRKAFDQALFTSKQTEKDFRTKLSPSAMKVIDQFLNTGRLFKEMSDKQQEGMAKALGPKFLKKTVTDPKTKKSSTIDVGASEQLMALYKAMREYKDKADPSEQVKLLFQAFDDIVGKKSIGAEAKQQLEGTFKKAISQLQPKNKEELTRAFEQLISLQSAGMSQSGIASVKDLLTQATQKGLTENRPAKSVNLVDVFRNFLNLGSHTLRDEDLKHLQKVFKDFNIEVQGNINRVFSVEEVMKEATRLGVSNARALQGLESGERTKVKDSLTKVKTALESDAKLLNDFKTFLAEGGFDAPISQFHDEVKDILTALGISNIRLQEIGEGTLTSDKFTGIHANLKRFFEQTVEGVQSNYKLISKGAQGIKLFGIGDKVFKPLFAALNKQFGTVEKAFSSIDKAVTRTRTIVKNLPAIRQVAAAQVAYRSDKNRTLQALIQASGLDTVQNFRSVASGAIKSRLRETGHELEEETERAVWKAVLAPSDAGLRSDLMKITKNLGSDQRKVVDAILESLGTTLNTTTKEFKTLASGGLKGYSTRAAKPFVSYLMAQFPSLLGDINSMAKRAVKFGFSEIVKIAGPGINRVLGKGFFAVGDFLGGAINRVRTTFFPGIKGLGGILTQLEVSVFGLSDTVNHFFEAKAKEIESRGSILSNTLGFIWGGLSLLFGGLIGIGKRVVGFVVGLRPKQKQVASEFQTITEEIDGAKVEKLTYPKEVKTAQQRAEFRKRYEEKLAAEEAAALKGSSPIQRAVSAVTEIFTRLRRRRELANTPRIVPPTQPPAYTFPGDAASPDAKHARELQKQQDAARRRMNKKTLKTLGDHAAEMVEQTQLPRPPKKGFATEPTRQVRPGQTPPSQFTRTPKIPPQTPATNVQRALPPVPGTQPTIPKAPGLASGEKAPKVVPVEGAIAKRGHKVGPEQGYTRTRIATAKTRAFELSKTLLTKASNPIFSAINNLGEYLQEKSRQIKLPSAKERTVERYRGRDQSLLDDPREMWDMGTMRGDDAGRIFEKVTAQPLTNKMLIAIAKTARDTAANVGGYFIDAASRSEGAWGRAGERIVEGTRIDADEVIPRRVQRQVMAYFAEIFLPVEEFGKKTQKQTEIAEAAIAKWAEGARIHTIQVIDVLLEPGKLFGAAFRKGAKIAGDALANLRGRIKGIAKERIPTNEEVWGPQTVQKGQSKAAPLVPVQEIREDNLLAAVMAQASKKVESLGLTAKEATDFIELEVAELHSLGLTTLSIIQALEDELKRTAAPGAEWELSAKQVGEAWAREGKKARSEMEQMGNTAKEQGDKSADGLNHGAADIVGAAWIREGEKARNEMEQMGKTAQAQGQRIVDELNHGAADVVGAAYVRECDRAEVAVTELANTAVAEATRIETAGQQAADVVGSNHVQECDRAEVAVTELANTAVAEAARIETSQEHVAQAIAHTGQVAGQTSQKLSYMGQVGSVFSGLGGTMFKFGGAAMAAGFAAQSATFSLQNMGLISEHTTDRLNKFFEIFSILSTLGTVVGPMLGAITSLFGTLGSTALLAFNPISLGIGAVVIGVGLLMFALKRLTGIDLITPLRNMLVVPFQQAILFIQSAWQSFIDWIPSRLKSIVMSGIETGKELVNALNHGAADVVAAAWERSQKFIKKQFNKIGALAGFLLPVIASTMKLVAHFKALSLLRTPGFLSLETLKGAGSLLGSLAVKIWQIFSSLKTASSASQVLTLGLMEVGQIVAPLGRTLPILSSLNGGLALVIKLLIQFASAGGSLVGTLVGILGLANPVVAVLLAVAATIGGVIFFIGLATGNFNFLSDAINAVGRAVTRLGAFFKGLIGSGAEVSQWLGNLFAPMQEHLDRSVKNLSTSFAIDPSGAESIGHTWGVKIFGGIKSAINQIKAAWTEFSNWFANLPIVKIGISMGQGLINALNHSPTVQIPEAWKEATETISGFLESLLKLGLMVGATIIAALSMKQLREAGTLLTGAAATPDIQTRRENRKTKFAAGSDKLEKIALYANVTNDLAELSGIELPSFVEPLTKATTLVAVLGDLSSEIIPLIVKGVRGIGLSLGMVSGIAGFGLIAIGAIYFAWKNNLFEIQEKTFFAVERIKEAWSGFSAWFTELPIVQSAIKIAQGLIAALNCHPTEVIPEAWQGASDKITGMFDGLGNVGETLGGFLNTALHPAPALEKAWEGAVGGIKERIGGIFGGKQPEIAAEAPPVEYGPQMPVTVPAPVSVVPEVTQEKAAVPGWKKWLGRITGQSEAIAPTSVAAPITVTPEPEVLPSKALLGTDKQAEAVVGQYGSQMSSVPLPVPVVPEVSQTPAVPKWKQLFDQATGKQPKELPAASVAAPITVTPEAEVAAPAKGGFGIGSVVSAISGLFKKKEVAPDEIELLRRPDNFMPPLDEGFGVFGDMGARDRQQTKLLDHEVERIDVLEAALNKRVEKVTEQNAKTNAAGFIGGFFMPDKVSNKQLKLIQQMTDKELKQLSKRRTKIESQLKEGIDFSGAQENFLKSIGIDPQGAEVAADKALEFIKSVPEKAKEAVTQAGLSLQDRVDYLKTTNGGYIGELFEPGYNQIKQNFGYLVEDAGTFAKDAGAALLRLDFDSLEKAAASFGENFGAIWNGVVSGFGSMGLSAIAAGVFFVTSLSPALLIVGGIALAALLIMTNFLGIRSIIKGLIKVLEGLFDIFEGVRKTVVDLLKTVYGLGKAFRNALAERSLKPIVEGFKAIGDAFRNNFPQIIRGFRKIGAGAKLLAEGMWVAAKQVYAALKFIFSPIKAVGDGIVAVFKRIKNAVLGLVDNVKTIPGQTKAVLEGFGDSIKNSIDQGVEKAKSRLFVFRSEVVDILERVVSGVETKMIGFSAAIFDALERAGAPVIAWSDRILGIFGGLMERIESLFKGGFERIGGVGVESFKSIRSFLSNLIPVAEIELGELVTATHRAFEKIGNVVRSFIPDVSAILTELKSRMPNIWEGMGQGVADVMASFERIEGAIKGTIDRITGELGKIKTTIIAVLEGVLGTVDAFTTGFVASFGKIGSVFPAINLGFQKIDELIKGISPETFVTSFREMTTQTLALIERIKAGILEGLGKPLDWIGGKWEGLTGKIRKLLRRTENDTEATGQQLISNLAQASPGPTYWIAKRWAELRVNLSKEFGRLESGAKEAGSGIEAGFRGAFASIEGRAQDVRGSFQKLGRDVKEASATAGSKREQRNLDRQKRNSGAEPDADRARDGINKSTSALTSLGAVLSNFAPSLAGPLFAVNDFVDAFFDLKDAAPMLKNFFNAQAAGTGVLAKSFGFLKMAVTRAWQSMIAPLLPFAGTILLVTAAFAGLFYLLYSTNLGGFADGVNQVLGYFKLFFELLGGGIMQAIGGVFRALDTEIRSIVSVLGQVAGWLFEPFIPLLSLFGIKGGGGSNLIAQAIKITVEAILLPIRLLGAALIGIIKVLAFAIKIVIILGGIVAKVLLAPFELLINAILLVGKVIKIAGDALGKYILAPFGNAIRGIFMGLASLGSAIVNSIGSAFAALYNLMPGPIKWVIDMAASGASFALNLLKRFLGAGAEDKGGSDIPGYATGGLIEGAGSPTGDNKLIWASPGEFVVNAAATAANYPLLQAINSSGGGLSVETPAPPVVTPLSPPPLPPDGATPPGFRQPGGEEAGTGEMHFHFNFTGDIVIQGSMKPEESVKAAHEFLDTIDDELESRIVEIFRRRIEFMR